MDEPHALAVELENPCLERLGEPWVEAGTEYGFEKADGRVGERRDSAHELECHGAEAVDAGVQELVEVGRDRELLVGRERAAFALERGRKLEREEGVAVRGFPEPEQESAAGTWRRGGCVGARGGAEAQSAHVHRPQPLVGHGAAQPLRHVAPRR